MCVLRCLIPGAVLLEFRGAYSQSRVSSHPDNADAVREILQSDEIHALQYRRQARYRHQNRCESRMITTGTLASDPVMHQHSGHHLLCEPHRPAASQGMSVIRMCRFLYAQTCATCRMGGASPSTFADLCTDVCPDMHQSSDAGRHHRYAASSPGLRRPRHTEQSGVSSAGSIPRCTAARTLFNGLSPVSSRDIIPLFGIRGTGHGRRPASHTFNGCYSHRSFSTDGAEDEHIDDSADTENAEYPAFAPPCRVRDSARDLAEREPSLADAFTFSGGSNRRPYPSMMKTQTGMPQS